VWGIDIGQCALKALKLRDVDGEVQVEAFEVIEHEQILSEPDANRADLIRNALELFLSRNNVSKCSVSVAVPGQSSFTRFVKLPPVETKKIPDIVRFEAEQQIPFPINDVIWRWQTFQAPDSPDVEVGIFAMKKADISAVLDHFTGVDMPIDFVQMAPLALYNFMTFDRQLAEDGATLLMDVGAEKTDLVVADGPRIWTRTIQIGGNNFTEALAKSFSLSFSKAEKLKRTAASSKYARQIFQAMRPVFADLQQETQRSIGYYTSLHRDTRFKRLLGLGNGFRLPGLQKFLEQNLNTAVTRVDSFNELKAGTVGDTPVFTENVPSLAVAYGLAVQGLELSAVGTNLLPAEIARKRLWADKRPWFAASAALLLGAVAVPAYREYADKSAMESSAALAEAKGTVQRLEDLRQQLSSLGGEGQGEIDKIQWYSGLFGYREYWPEVQSAVSKALLATAPDQKLLNNYMRAVTPQERDAALAALKAKPRAKREMIILDRVSPTYVTNVSEVKALDQVRAAIGNARESGAAAPAKPGQSTEAKRGFVILMYGRTPLPKASANTLLTSLLGKGEKIVAQYKQFKLVDRAFDFAELQAQSARTSGGRMSYDDAPAMPRTATPAGPAMPDPLLTSEDMSKDTGFVIAWVITIESNSPAQAAPAPSGNE
jgi:type IV pilus assembly protein PilM